MAQPKYINPGRLVWWQMFGARAARSLRLQSWFPHLPLALIVGGTGVVQLFLTSGSLDHLIAASGSGSSILSNVAGGIAVPAIRGVPQEAIGALLLLMGAGLLWRSRLAWVLAILLTMATVSLELSPLSSASRPLIFSNILMLVLLLLSRRSFTRASLATSTLFALAGVLLTLGYGALGSYVLGSGFHPRITNATDAIYFAVVTISTVGYGDITPQTHEARLFTVSLIVLGLAVFATSLTAIVGPLIDSRLKQLLKPRRKMMKRQSHIIVVGDGPLARSCVTALQARGLRVTAIWPSPQPDAVSPPEDLVVGDGSDTEVLRNAGIQQARAVLAISDDDSLNAFVVLAAKEANPNVRTVAAVGDASNTTRVARVHPDVVLALPVIASELLAMALSGDEIKADALLSELLKLG